MPQDAPNRISKSSPYVIECRLYDDYCECQGHILNVVKCCVCYTSSQYTIYYSYYSTIKIRFFPFIFRHAADALDGSHIPAIVGANINMIVVFS